MSLYTPAHFAGSNAEDALALIRAWPFATLVTSSSEGGEPHISHLPILLEGEGAAANLVGHMARANPHWQAFDRGHTTAIFHGPHAYISPNWYVDPAREVPTWNYATVHVHGRPVLMDARDTKLAQLDTTAAAFEPHENPWRRKVEGQRLEAMLCNIVAFHIPLTKVEAKFKLNQNRTSADRAQVMARLREQNHPELAAMAALMQAYD